MDMDLRRLADVAYDLADQFRAGHLHHFEAKDWRRTWQNLVDELRRRCPGFEEAQYSKALDRAFYESR
jgi:hypothetical protein